MLICKNIAEAFQKCLRAIFLPFPWIPQDDFTYLVCLDQFHLECIAALVHVESILSFPTAPLYFCVSPCFAEYKPFLFIESKPIEIDFPLFSASLWTLGFFSYSSWPRCCFVVFVFVCCCFVVFGMSLGPKRREEIAASRSIIDLKIIQRERPCHVMNTTMKCHPRNCGRPIFPAGKQYLKIFLLVMN